MAGKSVVGEVGKETANASRDPCHKHGVCVFQFRLTDNPTIGNCKLRLDHTQYAPHVVGSGLKSVWYIFTSAARSTRRTAQKLDRHDASRCHIPLILLRSRHIRLLFLRFSHLQYHAIHPTRRPFVVDGERSFQPRAESLVPPYLQLSSRDNCCRKVRDLLRSSPRCLTTLWPLHLPEPFFLFAYGLLPGSIHAVLPVS